MKIGPKQEEWLQYLEGSKLWKGECLRQTQGLLKYFDDSYCCLGVAAECVLKIEPNLKSMHNDDPSGIKEIFFGESQKILSNYEDLGLYSSDGKVHRVYAEHFHAEFLPVEKFVNCACTLAVLNDKGATFKQIAAAIRKYPEAVFIEGV